MTRFLATVSEWLDFVKSLPENTYLDEEVLSVGTRMISGNPLQEETFSNFSPTAILDIKGVLKNEHGGAEDVFIDFTMWKMRRQEVPVVLHLPKEDLERVLEAIKEISPNASVRSGKPKEGALNPKP